MSNIKIDNLNKSVTIRVPKWLLDKLNQLPKRHKSYFIRYAIADKIDDAIPTDNEVYAIIIDDEKERFDNEHR